MKTNDFELTRERKNILRKIKRNNVIDRSIAVSVSPIVVSVALVMLPVALVKTVAKHRKEPLKKLGNRLSKAFVKAVKFPKDVTEEVFKTGSAQLKSARESFAKEDVKKAELARKEEENRTKAEQKGVFSIKEGIKNTKRIDVSKTENGAISYKLHYDNGVKLYIFSDKYTHNMLVSDGKHDSEMSLSEYEYNILLEAIKVQIAALDLAKEQEKIDSFLDVLNQKKK